MLVSPASGALAPHLLALRRPAVIGRQALLAVRSADLLLKYSASPSKLPGRQYCSYRAKRLHTLRLRVANCRGQSVHAPSQIPLSGTRYRSCWSPSRLTAALARYRLKSSWHKPGCKWVRSEGDPRSTPRDKDCPACVHEDEAATELSRRELVWERQMEEMRKFVERDPYEALFGRSNERLRGLLGKAWPAGMWDERSFPWWVGKMRADSAKSSTEQEVKINSEAKEDGAKSENKPSSTSAEPASNNSTMSARHYGPRVVSGGGSWKVSGVSSGKTFEASGEFEYDPITMRMVPKSSKASVDYPKNLDSAKPEGSDGAINIPVKKSGETETTASSSVESPPKAEQKDDTPFSVESSESLLLKRKREGEARFLITTQTPAKLAPMIREEKEQNLPSTTQSSEERRNEMRAQWARVRMETTMIEHKLQKGNDKVENDVKSSSERETQEKDMMEAKQALEQSWAKENASRREKSTMKQPSKVQRESPKPSSNEEQKSSKTPEPVIVSPHYVFGTSSATSSGIPQLSMWIHSRKVPLKHLDARQLALHKAAIRQRFKKMDKQPESETKADKKLKEEIQTQKTAMTAFEDKWRHRKSHSEKEKTSPVPPRKLSAGEGDGRPNAPKFAGIERSHKGKTLDPALVDQQKLQDRALVKDIRHIYEKAYGNIDVDHAQGELTGQFIEDSWASESGPKSPEPQQTALAQDLLGANSTPATSQASEAGEPLPTARKETVTKADPHVYKVVAYDPENQQIYTATATSTFMPPTGDKVLSFTDALYRLRRPEKFISYLSKYQADGWQVVSAARHLLVLRRPSSVTESGSGLVIDGQEQIPPKRPSSSSNPEPITSQSTTSGNPSTDAASKEHSELPPTPQTGNFASPTGFVNHDVFSNEGPRPSSIPSPTNPRVRKEEAVFTGQPLKQSNFDGATASPTGPGGSGNGGHRGSKRMGNEHFGRGREHYKKRSSRFRRSLKRMVIVGTWVAACCYATGVVIEYFRNGPSNGGSGDGQSSSERSSWGDTRQVTESSSSSKRKERKRRESEAAAGMTVVQAQPPRSEWEKIKQGDSIVWKLSADIAMVVLVGYAVRTFLSRGN